jgi:Leucine-rich repeat (LRR) protein
MEPLIVRGSWNASYQAAIATSRHTELRLSSSAGWKGNSIEFLHGLTNIRSLEIYSWDVTDITPIQGLTNLEKLAIDCDYRQPVDFSVFARLKSLFLRWRSRSESIFRVTSLNELNLMNYPFESLAPLHDLANLETLKLTSKQLRSLKGVERLSRLEHLDLFQCNRLEGLSGIGGAPNLTNVELESCKKIGSIAPISHLARLQRLVVTSCGKIDSLLPLESNSDLEELFFIEDTHVQDGNMRIFERLSKLKKMWFANRPHYSHTREEIKGKLAKRRS